MILARIRKSIECSPTATPIDEKSYRTFFCWGRAKTLPDMISRSDDINWFVRSNHHHLLESYLARNGTSPTDRWLNRFLNARWYSQLLLRRHPPRNLISLLRDIRCRFTLPIQSKHGPHPPKYRKTSGEKRHKLSSERHHWDILGIAEWV